ncbi:hypothetical protein TPA0905_43880 [Streptomyces olivaceus]|nr:hypothetical protein TPA0905_43880 [Streptomyces olivaceus]
MVYLGAYGPMCPEELAGLRRRDVDLDNLVIRVRVAEPERPNGKRAPGETKSDAGVRADFLWFPAGPRFWCGCGAGSRAWLSGSHRDPGVQHV